jgi:hypothetical protein
MTSHWQLNIYEKKKKKNPKIFNRQTQNIYSDGNTSTRLKTSKAVAVQELTAITYLELFSRQT